MLNGFWNGKANWKGVSVEKNSVGKLFWKTLSKNIYYFHDKRKPLTQADLDWLAINTFAWRTVEFTFDDWPGARRGASCPQFDFSARFWNVNWMCLNVSLHYEPNLRKNWNSTSDVVKLWFFLESLNILYRSPFSITRCKQSKMLLCIPAQRLSCNHSLFLLVLPLVFGQ